MGEILKADLDSIRRLSDRQHGSASDIRGITVAPAFDLVASGLAGSDVAAACTDAAGRITSALSEVSGRVDTLAQTNRTAADTIGLADDTYAHNIKATLNLAP